MDVSAVLLRGQNLLDQNAFPNDFPRTHAQMGGTRPTLCGYDDNSIDYPRETDNDAEWALGHAPSTAADAIKYNGDGQGCGIDVSRFNLGLGNNQSDEQKTQRLVALVYWLVVNGATKVVAVFDGQRRDRLAMKDDQRHWLPNGLILRGQTRFYRVRFVFHVRAL